MSRRIILALAACCLASFNCRGRADARHDRRSRRDDRRSVVGGAARRDGDGAERRHEPGSQRDDRRARTFSDSGAPARHLRRPRRAAGLRASHARGCRADARQPDRRPPDAERRRRAGDRARRGRRAGHRPAADGRLERDLAGADSSIFRSTAETSSGSRCSRRAWRPIGRRSRGRRARPACRLPASARDRTTSRSTGSTTTIRPSAACARRSARRRCASFRCSPIRIPPSSARRPAASSTSSPRAARTRSAGNLFFFLRDEALNSKDHFERFNPAGQAIDREKAPYCAEAVRRHARRSAEAGSHVLFPVVRAARHRRPQLRHDRRHEQRDVSRAELRHAGGDSAARRLRDRDRPRARTTSGRISFSEKSIIS